MINLLLTFLLLQGSFSWGNALSCNEVFFLPERGTFVGRSEADVYITNERLQHILHGEWTPDGRLKGGLHTIEGLQTFLNFRKSLGLDANASPVLGMSRPDVAFPSVFLDPSIFTSQAGEAVRSSYSGGFASRYGKSLFPRGYDDKKILILIKAAVAQIDPQEFRSIVGTKQFRIPLAIVPPNSNKTGRFLFTLIVDRNQQVITFFPDGHQLGTTLSPIMAQNQPHFQSPKGGGGRMSQLSSKEMREINSYFSKPSSVFQPIQFSAEQTKHIPLYVLTLVRSGIDLKGLDVFFDRPEIATAKENYQSLRQKQMEQLSTKGPEFANELMKYVKFLMAHPSPLASADPVLTLKKKTLNINHFLTEANFLEGLQLLFSLERNGSLPNGTSLQIAKDYLAADRKNISWLEVATYIKTFEICIENLRGSPHQLSDFLLELPRYTNYWVLIHQPSQKSIQESNDNFNALVQTGRDPLRILPATYFNFTEILLNSGMVYQAAALGLKIHTGILAQVDTLHIFSNVTSRMSPLSRSEFTAMDPKAQWNFLGLLMDRINLQIETLAFSKTTSSAKTGDSFPTKEVFDYYQALGQKQSSLNIENSIRDQIAYLKNELQLGVDPEGLIALNVSYNIEDGLPVMSFPRFQIKKLSALIQNDPQLIQVGTRKINFQFGRVDGKISAPTIAIWSPIPIPDNVGVVRFAR